MDAIRDLFSLRRIPFKTEIFDVVAHNFSALDALDLLLQLYL